MIPKLMNSPPRNTSNSNVCELADPLINVYNSNSSTLYCIISSQGTYTLIKAPVGVISASFSYRLFPCESVVKIISTLSI